MPEDKKADNSDPQSTWGQNYEVKAEWEEKHGDENKPKDEPVVPDKAGQAPAGDANRPASTPQGPAK
jgi:hypothetical protein